MADDSRNGANAPGAVSFDPSVLREGMKNDNTVKHFVKLGTALLEQTNRPNVITVDEFRPFVPMFNVDPERTETDPAYKAEMTRLMQQWRHRLGINPYEITIVIKSREDPQEVLILNRSFTRIKSDVVDDGNKAMRDAVPMVPRTSSVSRDELIADASLKDLLNANNTQDQKNYFARVRMESALVISHFVRHHMTAKQRAEFLGNADDTQTSATSSQSKATTTTLLDDDD